MQHKGTMRDVFPTCLLIGGRRSVVVGGGMVAARKVRALLDAGATIEVISPGLGAALAPLAASGAITHSARAFSPTDIAGAFLVFAADDDRKLNRQVVRCCKDHGILCCSADANWTAGDFVSPVTFRDKGMVVAVSTGGRSCRRSRLLKASFQKHLASVDAADLLVIGTSHHQLPVGRREPYHLAGTRLADTSDMLRHVLGIHELVLLNTCNRIEIAAVVARDIRIEQIIQRVLGFDQLGEGDYYVKRGHDAFAHVALVTAGLLSQTPGEQHIVAQVKEAVETAVRAGWAGGMMREWLAAALRVARDVRVATKSLLRACEIEDLAIAYPLAVRHDRSAPRFLVIGTGVIGAGIVQRCIAQHSACDWCYHREKPVLKPTWKDKVTLCTFSSLRDRLADADVIVCATASPHYVLDKTHAPFFDHNKDVLIIDLAMPRNVEPGLHGLTPTVCVADLDDLKQWHRRVALDMPRIMDAAAHAIAQHNGLYNRLTEAWADGVQR